MTRLGNISQQLNMQGTPLHNAVYTSTGEPANIRRLNLCCEIYITSQHNSPVRIHTWDALQLVTKTQNSSDSTGHTCRNAFILRIARTYGRMMSAMGAVVTSRSAARASGEA